MAEWVNLCTEFAYKWLLHMSLNGNACLWFGEKIFSTAAFSLYNCATDRTIILW